MPDSPATVALPARSMLALIATDRRRIALVLGTPDRWRSAGTYTLVPAEFPAAAVSHPLPTERDIATCARRLLGCSAHVLPAERIYGPSTHHRMDRLEALPAERPRPLLRLEREEPAEPPTQGARIAVQVRAYRVALEGTATPGAGTAGVLWLPLAALRAAMRGAPLAETLARPHVGWQPGVQATLPDDALLYVPADYGERHLLRLAAKYGEVALFPPGDTS
jgi:hypothetical protein